MVPLLSLSASTQADEMPSAGLETSWDMNDSHFPFTVETSSFPDDTDPSMSGDLPIVPRTMIVSLRGRSHL
jgi:hypothetical protein